MSLDPKIETRLRAIQKTSRALRSSTVEPRNKTLLALADKLGTHQDEIFKANATDLKNLDPKTSSAFRDRLTLNPERIALMQESLRQVAKLADPLAVTAEARRLPNGLLLKRVRAPLGVILMIFESRPNVITEAFSLALKSGNALILRGGSDSLETSRVIYRLVEESLTEGGFAPEVFWGVTDPDRALAQTLMQQNRFIDVLVPRGGDGLIKYVVENAKIPIIKNDRGMCHVYVHDDASGAMAIDIVENSKTQRPGVCNSMETLLLNEKQIALLPQIYDRLQKHGVEWFGCERALEILRGRANVHAASEKSFDTEYLEQKMNCRIVDGLETALSHIERHGSRHSESIITASESVARLFQNSVDAAVTYWNASTRFTDGFEFGLGGELGISTQKLHVRGPVGLNELTSLRWVVDGTGQIRK